MLDKIFGLFSDAKELASEAIIDVDKRLALLNKIDELKEQVYIQELKTKTIPWVDALHKMSRPIIAVVTIVTAGVVVTLNPDMEIAKLLTIIGGGSVPATAYTVLKGKGK